MLKKRLIPAIIVKDNIAVQSFAYSKYLPLGSPLIMVENYNRWNADEILVQSIDRTKLNLGPDFKLLNEISSKKINTPLIYGGGIRSVSEAKEVIKFGADRIIIGDLFLKKPNIIKNISEIIGEQAIIISLPVVKIQKLLFIYDYLTKQKIELKEFFYKNNLVDSSFEFMISDINNEGSRGKFDMDIIKNNIIKKNIIVFGGINPEKNLSKIYKYKNISAVCVGNFFSYSEHSYQKSLNQNKHKYLRQAYYSSKWI